MPGHDIIVVGASAGGVESLVQLTRELPPDLDAAVFVVLHMPSQGTSVLPTILNRVKTIPAVHPHDGQAIQPGRIYVAPPDHHLLVKRGHLRVVRGPRENGHRPAADALFRTAAVAYGPRVVGVVLSGSLDDGTAGLGAIKRRGGVAVVQDPNDALYPGMPSSALDHVAVDHVLPIAQIGPMLVRLADQPAGAEEEAVTEEMNEEADMAELDAEALQDPKRPGKPSGFGCPECGGVLFELEEGQFLRFRCRVGHAWSPDSLLSRQTDQLEAALWTALRAIEENAALARRLAGQARQRGYDRAATRFHAQVDEMEKHALGIRQVLLSRKSAPPAEADPSPEATGNGPAGPKANQA